MKFLTSIIIISFLFSSSLKAQDNIGSHEYKTALGVKFYPGAVSLKHFIKPKAALEGLGYFWNRGFRVTGLYEFHNDINGVEGLKWYVGPGAHVGFYNSKHGGGSSFGVDGVIGLDYKIREAPINLSVDWQPSIEFNGAYDGFSGNWGGLAIRYVF